jgi:hypothetical protein
MQPVADHRAPSQRPYWCAVVVLLAVCALTISVTTRFTSSEISPTSTATTVRKHLSPENIRQRLTRDAATWLPPVVGCVSLQLPAVYPRIAPTALPLRNSFFETSLYNRPPPVATFLA